MGKLKDGLKKNKYEIIKKQNKIADEQKIMCIFLKNKWKNDVKFTCFNCLQLAYESEVNETNGYVTDEDLIKSSNNKLRHK
jgi:hypothetical protein